MKKLKNEDVDNTYHKNFTMNASKSSFNESFFGGQDMICHYVIDT